MTAPLFALTLHLLVGARLDSPVTDRAEALAKQAIAQSNSPRGAAPLIRLHALLDEVDDLNLLAGPYASLLFRRATDPDVRLLTRMFYADLERARGRTTKAVEMLEPLGFIQDFHVVGSFDNEGKAGCDTDFGPESALDLKASYPAKDGEVSWAPLPARTPDGYVDLSLAVKPTTEAVAYALTFLQAEKETKVDLAVGAAGAFRLFVNGVKVLKEDRYNQPRVDQSRVRVTLRKGTNRVLLKLCNENGALGFYLRQERADGAPAPAKVTLPDAVPALEKGPAPQPQVLPTLASAMAALVKAKPSDAVLRADYATVLAWSKAFDEREKTAAHEAETAATNATDVEVLLAAAQLQGDEPNLRRKFLEAALKLQPGSAWVRSALADHEQSMEHSDRALVLLEAVLKDFPRFGPALQARVRALEALGEKTHSMVAAEEAFAANPLLPRIARDAVSASRRLDRPKEAAERSRLALGLRFDDLSTRRGLAGLLADLGQVNEAVEQLERVLVMDPFDNQTRVRLAELLAANGQLEPGLLKFGEAKKFAPKDPDVVEREGRALLKAGRVPDALLAFRKSLELKPQQPALKEVVRALEGDDASSASKWAMPIAPLLEAAKGIKNEDAVALAEVTSVRVQSSGLSSRFNQLAVKVLTQRGVEQYRQLPITYSPDRQEVRVLKARLTHPDGSVVDSYGDQERAINEPWTGMYYDARARVLSFPTLAPGDVLDVQWRLEDTAQDNLLSDYWGDTDAVQSTVPRLNYRYIIDMPKDRPLYWNKSVLPAWVKNSATQENGRTIYQFEATNVPKVVPEPQMPGWAEVATLLHVSTYQSWDQVGRYYWGLVRDQLVPNEDLKKTVDATLKGIDRKDTQKVVAALYGFVVTNTRYVALEFGIHGYKPYRVDRILARRFGDCKDKASLMTAMLKLAGVDAKLVLLRMRSLGNLNPEPASLSAFNHAIVYVPALNRFLDGTAEFHGATELPGADRVANVLVVEPDGKSTFLTTPEAAPEDNLTELRMDVVLQPDGSASMKSSMVAKGQGAPEFRREYQAANSRKSTFEQAWAMSFPGLKVGEVTVSDLTKLEEPVKLEGTLSTPRYAEALPGALRFYPFGAGRAYTQALAPLGSRKFDLVLSGVWKNEFHYSYALPSGFAAEELFEDVSVDSPFGTLLLTAKMVEGKLKIDGALTLKAARIKAADYPQFREWLLKVDQTLSRKLTVRRVGGQTAAR